MSSRIFGLANEPKRVNAPNLSDEAGDVFYHSGTIKSRISGSYEAVGGSYRAA